MASIITKTIRGRKYEYIEYFEDGKTVQMYCGPAGSVKAKAKALQLEYEWLGRKRAGIADRMAAIKLEIKELPDVK